jgi:uncharacterized protein YccT (UPF0319 family)
MISRAMREHGLTPKQAEAVIRYTLDPEVIGNQTQTGLVVYDTINTDVARTLTHEALHKPAAQTYIQQLLEDSGVGVEVRSSILADIATNKARSTKTLTMKNAEGEVTSVQEIEADVPASVRLRAIAHANKIDGTTDTAAATVRIAEAEYSLQRKKLLRDAGR